MLIGGVPKLPGRRIEEEIFLLGDFFWVNDIKIYVGTGELNTLQRSFRRFVVTTRSYKKHDRRLSGDKKDKELDVA
jgi:hypothetical protein